MKKFLLFFILAGSLFLVGHALAANPLGQAQTNLNNAVGGIGLSNDVGTSIGTVVKALLSVVGTIFLILTIYAGILWMTAQGNEEKVGQAQGIVRSAVIGLFVVMAAYAITAFVTARVGGVASSGDNLGCCIGQGSAAGVCAANQKQTDCPASNVEIWQAGACPAAPTCQ